MRDNMKLTTRSAFNLFEYKSMTPNGDVIDFDGVVPRGTGIDSVVAARLDIETGCLDFFDEFGDYVHTTFLREGNQNPIQLRSLNAPEVPCQKHTALLHDCDTEYLLWKIKKKLSYWHRRISNF